LSLPHLRGLGIDVSVLYPRDLPVWTSLWDAHTAGLTIMPAHRTAASARLLRIVPAANPTEGTAR